MRHVKSTDISGQSQAMRTAGAEGPLLSREWQLILARAYRMLAEAEGELASRRLSVAA